MAKQIVTPTVPWVANASSPFADGANKDGNRDGAPVGGLITPDLTYVGFDSGNDVASINSINFDFDVFSGDGEVVVSNDDSISGNNSYRFRYFPNTEWTERRFSYDSTSELWVSYWIKVPNNFTHAGQFNLKLFVLYMDGYIQGGTGSTLEVQMWPNGDGTTYPSFTMHNQNPGRSVHGAVGNQIPQYDDFIVESRDQGRWMQLVFHVNQSSTVSAQDGILEAWRRWDGESGFTKFAEYNDLCISSATDNSSWQGGYLMGWANAGYAQQTDWLVDDFSMYSSNPGV